MHVNFTLMRLTTYSFKAKIIWNVIIATLKSLEIKKATPCCVWGSRLKHPLTAPARSSGWCIMDWSRTYFLHELFKTTEDEGTTTFL